MHRETLCVAKQTGNLKVRIPQCGRGTDTVKESGHKVNRIREV